MQEIILRKHNVIKCPAKDCGAIRVTSGKKGKCFRCGHTWTLMDKQQGGTRGVLDSYHRPQDATKRAMREKEISQ